MFSDHKPGLLLELQMTKNRCELSAMISENFEITCMKWLRNHTCTPVKPSVTNENFIFF